MVRIPGFHPGGPGSIPGVGTYFCVVISVVVFLAFSCNYLDILDREALNVLLV